VRAADRTSSGLLEHCREIDSNTELVQALYHALGARTPHVTKRDELCFELPRIGQVESEYVSFHIALDGAELDARHHADAKSLSRRRCFGDAGDGVMIGQRDGGEPNPLGFANDVGWSARAVGGGRVRVQIDERAGAVAVSDWSAHAE
jgi:hypothetical protein